MTKKDITKRGVLAKLEEIVRSCIESYEGNLDNFQFEMADVFSSDELSEIDYMIEKLKDDRECLKLFCLF